MNKQPPRPPIRPPQPSPSNPVGVEAPPPLKFGEPTFTPGVGDSIMPEGIRGAVIVTGFRGMGKTTFGLGVDHPDKILMLDYESKGESLALPYGIGGYFGIMDEVLGLYGQDFDAQVIFDRTMQIIKAAPENRFTALFLDNASYVQDGAAQLVRNNPAKAIKYGLKAENILSGGYGGPWPAVGHLINNLFKLAYSRGIRLVVASFQLKGAWKDGRPLFNKMKITDVGKWHEESILSVALVEPMPEHAPCPRGLIMKESLGQLTWDPELKRSVMRRRLPYALPRAEMWEVYNYMANPVDFTKLKPGESVDAMELGPFTPTFSRDQILWMERAARAQALLMGDIDEPNGHSGDGDGK